MRPSCGLLRERHRAPSPGAAVNTGVPRDSTRDLPVSLVEASRRAFSETADPDAYVDLPASAAALRSIADWQDERPGSPLAAVVAPPGLGKTMLLRVVESRSNRQGLAAGTPAARPSALYLPYAGLEPADLAIWIHGLLGHPCPAIGEDAADAIAALRALGDAAEAPLTLLLDDADSMPAATIAALTDQLPREGGPLRLLLALNPDSKGSRLLAALHALGPREIRHRTHLSPAETGEYVRGRMRWAGFPGAEVARVDEAEAQRIHALSNGVPRAIHAVALDRFGSAASVRGAEDLAVKRRREGWMGRPIEDDLEP